MKDGKNIKTIHISDIHLGNRRVPVTHMIKGLRSTINSKLLAEADILFIAGDFWDRELTLPGNRVPEIVFYIHSLLKLCKEHNVKVRVLEGTPSHDRKQSVVFEYINKMLAEPADYRYYDKLCIDHEEDLGIDVLYVPDEWKHSTEAAWEDVVKEMKLHNLDQVDYAIMHGMFKYQVPAGLNLPCHDEDRYLPIVRRFISIGHVHTMSNFKHIFAQGSHDRISHNEEESKGLVFASSDFTTLQGKINFIENKLAMPFVSVDVIGMEEIEASKTIDLRLQQLLDNKQPFHFRVIMDDDPVIRGIYKKFKKEYPDVNWQEKINKVKKLKDATNNTIKLKDVVKPINKSSAPELVEAKLAYRGTMSDVSKAYIRQLVESIDD